MKALLLTALILAAATSPIVAQKKSTLLGDVVIGELTAKDEATRELTIKYPGKEGTEIFTGFLADNYKLRRDDDSPRELKLNDIVPGMHIRVFYKSAKEKVGGQEKKINKIHRLDFLGKDEHARLREQLNIDTSVAIALAEQDNLPAISPLKVYLAVPYSAVHQNFVAWVDKWNRKNGDVYGKLELVSDWDGADVLIVVARGADTMVTTLPMLSPDGRGVAGEMSHATSYLVVKDPGGLKVLWTRIGAVYSSANTEISPKTNELVEGELEKRMKARSRSSKK